MPDGENIPTNPVVVWKQTELIASLRSEYLNELRWRRDQVYALPKWAAVGFLMMAGYLYLREVRVDPAACFALCVLSLWGAAAVVQCIWNHKFIHNEMARRIVRLDESLELIGTVLPCKVAKWGWRIGGWEVWEYTLLSIAAGWALMYMTICRYLKLTTYSDQVWRFMWPFALGLAASLAFIVWALLSQERETQGKECCLPGIRPAAGGTVLLPTPKGQRQPGDWWTEVWRTLQWPRILWLPAVVSLVVGTWWGWDRMPQQGVHRTEGIAPAVPADFVLYASFPVDGGQPKTGRTPLALVIAEPVSGKAPLTVRFRAAAAGATGKIAGVSWDFGDGRKADRSEAQHTYPKPGTYPATLTVRSDHDSATREQFVITVEGK